jgi:multidrug efflux pump subunit AcrB
MKAAQDAVANTQWPLLGATVIGIMAFSGIGLSPDSTGEFLFSLFAVIGISLLLSWLLAITVAPMIAYHLFKGEKGKADADPYGGPVYGAYRAMLTGALKRRWLTVAALLLITVASYVGFGQVRQSFFPDSNTPMFYVNIMEPQGADILTTDETLRDIAAYAGAQAEAVSVDAFVGRGATRFMLTYVSEQPNTAYGQLVVRTEGLEEIPALGDRILDYIADTYPDVEARVDRIVFGPPSGAQLEARFIGPDADVLRALGRRGDRALRAEGNVRDLRTDWRNRELVLRPQIVEERARTIGLTRADIGDALRFATEGVNVGVYREGDTLIPIIARAPEAERAIADNLSDRLIWSPAQNAYVPLSQAVDGFALEARDTLIQRRDRVRTLTVQANPPQGETAASAFVRFSAIAESVELPRGYRLEWGGEHYASQQANESLGGVLPFSLLVMVVTSILLFQTVRQPLIIWLIVPMSVIGVTVGLLATNVAFSFTALLGLLVAVGHADQERHRSGRRARSAHRGRD